MEFAPAPGAIPSKSPSPVCLELRPGEPATDLQANEQLDECNFMPELTQLTVLTSSVSESLHATPASKYFLLVDQEKSQPPLLTSDLWQSAEPCPAADVLIKHPSHIGEKCAAAASRTVFVTGSPVCFRIVSTVQGPAHSGPCRMFGSAVPRSLVLPSIERVWGVC